MAYTDSNITVIAANAYDGGLRLRVHNGNAGYRLQGYIDGNLVGWQTAPGASWEFSAPLRGSSSIIYLLAVDEANLRTNYWAAAFPDTAEHRLDVKMAQTVAPFLPTDKWRVYRGDAGDASATTKVHEALVYPSGQFACGFGAYFGSGGFGWDAAGAKGFGYSFGLGEFGIDCQMIHWRSDPLPRGTYPVKATIVDAAGNESTASTGSITLPGYARPVADLTVTSYTSGSDTLVLGWTESGDVS
jgi:hypothetical protein